MYTAAITMLVWSAFYFAGEEVTEINTEISTTIDSELGTCKMISGFNIEPDTNIANIDCFNGAAQETAINHYLPGTDQHYTCSMTMLRTFSQTNLGRTLDSRANVTLKGGYSVFYEYYENCDLDDPSKWSQELWTTPETSGYLQRLYFKYSSKAGNVSMIFGLNIERYHNDSQRLNPAENVLYTSLPSNLTRLSLDELMNTTMRNHVLDFCPNFEYHPPYLCTKTTKGKKYEMITVISLAWAQFNLVIAVLSAVVACAIPYICGLAPGFEDEEGNMNDDIGAKESKATLVEVEMGKRSSNLSKIHPAPADCR